MKTFNASADYADGRRFKNYHGVKAAGICEGFICVNLRNLRKKVFPCAVLAAALTGCSMTPDYRRPAAPVAAAWPDNAKPNGARRVADTDWRRYYPDPRLQGLIAAALENNRDLRIATARIAEARAQYGIQQADRLPNVNVTAGHNASLTPAGASFTGQSINAKRYDAGISLVSFELDFWGRVASLNEAAKAGHIAPETVKETITYLKG